MLQIILFIAVCWGIYRVLGGKRKQKKLGRNAASKRLAHGEQALTKEKKQFYLSVVFEALRVRDTAGYYFTFPYPKCLSDNVSEHVASDMFWAFQFWSNRGLDESLPIGDILDRYLDLIARQLQAVEAEIDFDALPVALRDILRPSMVDSYAHRHPDEGLAFLTDAEITTAFGLWSAGVKIITSKFEQKHRLDMGALIRPESALADLEALLLKRMQRRKAYLEIVLLDGYSEGDPLTPEQRCYLLLQLSNFLPVGLDLNLTQDEARRAWQKFDPTRRPSKDIAALYMAKCLYRWRDQDADSYQFDMMSTLRERVRMDLSVAASQIEIDAFEGIVHGSLLTLRLLDPTDAYLTPEIYPLTDAELLAFAGLAEIAKNDRHDRSPTAHQKLLISFARPDGLADTLESQLKDAALAKKNTAADHKTWLERNGGNARAHHLVADGWLAFLQSLDAPDIRLWHQIATDFHELAGDRLEAVFWILEQPECDRLTAHDFIVGAVHHDIFRYRSLDEYVKAGAPQSRFAAVIDRWNAGFYRHHSLDHGDWIDIPLINDVTADQFYASLKAFEADHDLAPLPRPKSICIDLTAPPDDLSRAIDVGLSFWDDQGLELRYPHDWYRDNWKP